MRKHWKYLGYVLRHKWFVFLACARYGLWWRGLTHDLSKFLPSEWSPYVWSFNGPWAYKDRPQWVKDAFDLAWCRHQNRADHHWAYWMLTNDSEEPRVLPMSDAARTEMLCDWLGASMAQGHGDTWQAVADWYERGKAKIHLHPETRKLVELWLSEEK